MEELFKENIKIVFHFLFTLCHDESLTEELTQETFLKAYQSIERFDGSCKVSTWLCSIARNIILKKGERSMGKINCNIIQDLLPSYVDEITSEESNQMIEEHFRECELCKKVYESLKEHDFAVERAEVGIAGYLKKVGLKKRMKHRGVLLTTMCLFSVQIILNFSNVMLSSLHIVNCIFYPIYIFLLFDVLGTWKEQDFCSKIDKRILVMEGITLFYIVGTFYALFVKTANGETHPFGLELYQTGPFIEYQVKILLIVYFLAILIYFTLQKKVKKYNQNTIIMLLAGAAILLNIRVGLYHMVSFLPTIKTISIFLAAVLLESILLCGFVHIHSST